MRQTARAVFGLAAAGLVAAATLVAQEAPPATAWNGVFTTAQAERGGDVFNGALGCASCHGFDGALGGDRDMFPPLAGDAFVENMTGRPVAYLHDYIRDNKPADAPGSLAADTVLDLTAYILEGTGSRPGTATGWWSGRSRPSASPGRVSRRGPASCRSATAPSRCASS